MRCSSYCAPVVQGDDMKAIFDLFRRLAESAERGEQERQDAYLAESTGHL
jgi:hypothetical protein